MVIAARPDLGFWWAPMLAFAAGVVSFASPCVLPLVPGYIAFVTGDRTANRASGNRVAHRVGPIVLFILGFSLVFTLLGTAGASWVPLLKGELGERVAGGFVALTGLVMLANAFGRGVRWIFEDRRPFLSKVRPGTASALPLGMAFAVGWTPCVGPVLAAILGLAATGGAARAAILLFAYSTGLGVPFLALGLGVQLFAGAFEWVRRQYQWILGLSGVTLLVIGLLVAMGAWTRLMTRFAGYGAAF